MSTRPNIAAIVRNDNPTAADFVAVYEGSGMKAPSSLLTARDEAVAAGAAGGVTPVPGDAAPPSEPAPAAEPGQGSVAPETPSETPAPETTPERGADGKFVARKTKVKIADGDEVDLVDDDLRALILAHRNRPVWEQNLAAQKQEIEAQRMRLGQDAQQQLEAIRAERAAAQKELAEAREMRQAIAYSQYADAERAEGRLPSIEGFRATNPVSPPTPSPTLSEDRVRQLFAEERQRARAEAEEQYFKTERTRKANYFNEAVNDAIEKMPNLKGRAHVWNQVIGGAIADHLRERGADIFKMHDAALKGIVMDAATYFDKDEGQHRLKSATSILDQHAGKALPPATPVSGTGTPSPTTAVKQGAAFSPQDYRDLYDKNGRDMMKTLKALDRAELEMNKEAARFAGR